MKTFYIGRFPSPYGGVTIKNKMLYENLSKYIGIEKIELGLVRKMNFREIAKLTIALVNSSNTFIIGSASTSRRFFSGLLYYINRRALNRSVLIVMGGECSRVIANDAKYSKWVKEYKQVYVETKGMQTELNSVGVKNVSIFPNCRETPHNSLKVKVSKNKNIRCLYFSLISKDKGADIVIEAAKILNKRRFPFFIDFYGHIDREFTREFLEEVDSIENVKYCGVYSADQESVYPKLNQYDMLLFPTKCITEGVPGVLVEAKIAALPSIVSNVSYNSEIIRNENNGIVLKENSPIELANMIERLYIDNNLLMNMKINAKASGNDYLIEHYLEDIVNMIKR